MILKRHLSVIVLVCNVFFIPPAFGLHARLVNAKGESVFSKEFINDYESAERELDTKRSAEPFIKLLKKYSKPDELAELELTIGLLYNQRYGVVDPAKAVVHLTNALKYDLPEQVYIEILMWRGNSLEQLQKNDKALRDYLRGLLACSYHDLSGEWPEFREPKVPISKSDSDDPEGAQREKDFQIYRKTIDFQRFLIMQRYYFVEAVRRLRSISAISNDQVLKNLSELSPDTGRFDSIIKLLNAENKRPWP